MQSGFSLPTLGLQVGEPEEMILPIICPTVLWVRMPQTSTQYHGPRLLTPFDKSSLRWEDEPSTTMSSEQCKLFPWKVTLTSCPFPALGTSEKSLNLVV